MNSILTTARATNININLSEENSMKLKFSAIAIAAVWGVSVSAYGGLLSKDELKRQNDRISADFKAQKQACDSRSGNAKDICMAEAKGHEKVAKAELDARDKGTAKSREDALAARADADYDVAKQRCDDLAGNTKDVCLKDAKAAQTKAKANATLARKSTDAKSTANEKISDAQVQANNTKRDADYKAARERCDSLAGNAKDVCLNEAKARFAKL
jgi:hypothetical protein